MLPILNQSFWRDEAFSVLLSLKSPVEIVQLTMRDTNPPLYYLLLHFWMILFGNGEASVRGMSFLFHLGIVLFAFLIMKHFFSSTKATILTGFAVLLNPFLLQYAFEARAYSLLALLTLIAVWCIVKKRLLFGGLFIALSILTHNYGILNLVAIGIWWLFQNRTNVFTKKLRESVELFVLPASAIILWGAVIWNQWAKVAGGFWIKQSTTSLWLLSLQKYSSGDINISLQSNLYLVSFVVIFFALSFWVWKGFDDENKSELSLLSFLIFIPTAITYAVSALFAPIYQERYLISALPIAIILIGYLSLRLFQANARIKTILIALVSIYCALLVLGSEQIVGSSTKAPINYAVSQILMKSEPSDIVVPNSPLNFLETKYYLRNSGSEMPVYTLSKDGKVPFYIGGVLFSKDEIIKSLPKGVRIWRIDSDASVKLIRM